MEDTSSLWSFSEPINIYGTTTFNVDIKYPPNIGTAFKSALHSLFHSLPEDKAQCIKINIRLPEDIQALWQDGIGIPGWDPHNPSFFSICYGPEAARGYTIPDSNYIVGLFLPISHSCVVEKATRVISYEPLETRAEFILPCIAHDRMSASIPQSIARVIAYLLEDKLNGCDAVIKLCGGCISREHLVDSPYGNHLITNVFKVQLPVNEAIQLQEKLPVYTSAKEAMDTMEYGSCALVSTRSLSSFEQAHSVIRSALSHHFEPSRAAISQRGEKLTF